MHDLRFALRSLGKPPGFTATVIVTLARSLLFITSPRDPVALPAILVVLGLVACWLPARRATKVDPLVALRAA